MKKYVSLSDIENAIALLESYKEEHHKDGELYYALSIAVHIMSKDYMEVIADLMYTDRDAKFDS